MGLKVSLEIVLLIKTQIVLTLVCLTKEQNGALVEWVSVC